MTRIVPTEWLSLEEERSLVEALLSRTPFSSSAERLWQIVYPGYALALFEISAGNTLHLHLQPTGDPICPACGKACARIKDSSERTITEASFLGVERTLVHLKIRRVRCECGCCRTERITWLDPHCRYTRRLASEVQTALRCGRSVSEVSLSFDLNWKAVKTLDKEQLKFLFDDPDVSGLRRMAIDEFAIHKGHKYATAFMDLDTGKVFYVVKGKTQKAIEVVFEWLKDKGVADQIECVAVDMNAGFPAMVKKHLPKATLVYDLFHVMQHFTRDVLIEGRKFLFKEKSQALSAAAGDGDAPNVGTTPKDVRKAKREAKKELRGAEWLMVRSINTLLESARERLGNLIKDNAMLAALYPIAEQLRGIWRATSREEAAALLAELTELLDAIAEQFSFQPARLFAAMLRRRSSGIVEACTHRVGTNRLEGANNKIKVLKRIAYGFRDFEYFALKIKGLLPGKGRSPWDRLSNGRVVVGNAIRDTQLWGGPTSIETSLAR